MKTKFVLIGSEGSGALQLDGFLSSGFLQSADFTVFSPRLEDRTRWHLEEFSNIASREIEPAYAYSPADAWNAEVFEQFTANGWYALGVCSHPGTQLCRAYFERRARGELLDLPLDNFISNFLDGSLSDELQCALIPPDYFSGLHEMVLFRPEELQAVFLDTFGLRIDVAQLRAHNQEQGFRYYREAGLISASTEQRLLDSQIFTLYQRYRSAAKKSSK